MERIEGVVLAAGLSSRVGANKMILDMAGRAVIERCILPMYDICSKILVVSGHRPGQIERILDGYSKVQIIHNENYLDGMYSSVKTGLKHITGNRFFLIPGDYPALRPWVYEAMLKTRAGIVIPAYQGRRGHPVLMESSLIPEILEGKKFNNLREFIRSKEPKTLQVDEPGILLDIDTMDDYHSIKSYFVAKIL